ncbi:hypothetical protein MTO96_005701 [Rhipicephalus appendiculatus]
MRDAFGHRTVARKGSPRVTVDACVPSSSHVYCLSGFRQSGPLSSGLTAWPNTGGRGVRWAWPCKVLPHLPFTSPSSSERWPLSDCRCLDFRHPPPLEGVAFYPCPKSCGKRRVALAVALAGGRDGIFKICISAHCPMA